MSGDLACGTDLITSFLIRSLCRVEWRWGPACDGDCDDRGVDKSVRMSDRGLTLVESRVAGTEDESRSFEPPTPRELELEPHGLSSICQKLMFLRVCGAVTVDEGGGGCRL